MPVDVLPLLDWRKPRNWLRQLPKVVASLGLISLCLDLLIADAACQANDAFD